MKTTRSGVYGLLFADLLRRWIWHALALCAYVVVFSQAVDLRGEGDVELPIVCHGVFVCLAAFLIMHADGKAAVLPVFVALPVGRARLAAFVWCKLVIVPPAVMTATNVFLFVMWGGANLLFLLASFCINVVALGTLVAVAALWAELQHRMVVRFGVQRGPILLICAAFVLVVLTTVVVTAFAHSVVHEHLAACLAAILVVGLFLSAISWVKREWLLHIYVENRQGSLKRTNTRRRTSAPLRYPRMPWLTLFIRPTPIPVALFTFVVLVFLLLDRRHLSSLTEADSETRLGMALITMFLLPFANPARLFPLRVYRMLPLSSWSLTLRSMGFYATPIIASILILSPLLLPQPDGLLFLLAILCFAGVFAVAWAIGWQSVRVTLRLPLLVILALFVFTAYGGLIQTFDEKGRVSLYSIVHGVVLTAISTGLLYRNVTRSSEAYRLERRELAKEDA